MYVIIDNYDSFTHNLYQYLCELTEDTVEVFRNDRITVDEIIAMSPAGIVISPGPGRPEEAGISVECVQRLAGITPILGVCLGLQAIGQAFGARIVPARRIVHGKTEEMSLDGRGLFRGLPRTAKFTRYHSLVIERDSLPQELEVTAVSPDGEIMGVRHTTHVVEGLQFHPESIASETGKRCLRNFLRYRREPFPLSSVLGALQREEAMNRADAEAFMDELTDGQLTDVQIAGVLASLTGELITPDTLAGFASVLRRKKKPFTSDRKVLDTCGTGGDGLGTFNISSLAAVVAASCGAFVAKHGNRAASSPCGSADFYRELGVPVDVPAATSEKLLRDTGFCFLFAPTYHGAMRHAAKARAELGVKSVMNLIGPLSNPADASYQLIGVFDAGFCGPIAEAAHLLGVRRVMVVHGEDGLDEVSVSARTLVVEVDETGARRDYTLTPEEFGIPRFPVEALKGGTAAQNVATALAVLEGAGPDAIREAVLLNAGAGLYICGISRNIGDGYLRARQALESGDARAALARIRGEHQAGGQHARVSAA
ncbi:MAG TPA: bifunctional anthranilate synthase component II/anthranilate phosphoribosyltransferase [Spirochaetia bacterium]|nr:bifunctional anthranilate synthase component II/anthranilate phosphoribosyltransferase [Spirochaetia bacterium]